MFFFLQMFLKLSFKLPHAETDRPGIHNCRSVDRFMQELDSDGDSDRKVGNKAGKIRNSICFKYNLVVPHS